VSGGASQPGSTDAGSGTRAVTLITSTVPFYRRSFLEMLEERLAGRLRVLAGTDYFDPIIRLELSGRNTTVVPNRYLFGRRLLWQGRTIVPALQAEVVIAELNPRILSTWLVLILRRALGRPIVLWGHAWSRGGADVRGDRARHLMRRLASAVVVYSETQARELRRRMPRGLVMAAPNALYPLATQTSVVVDQRRPADFVFVGRLVESKKPRLLLEAFLLAVDDLPLDARLLFVGDGPLRKPLEERASAVSDRVLFTGTRSEFEQLRAVYSRAMASVIPGYAGLSLIQSLWFGVPALIARHEPHSPEIEAAVEGVNAVYFASDSVSSLRDVLLAVAREREAWGRRRSQIARECAAKYSVDGMVDACMRAVEAVAP
jgi:glycosyltransferase involved in cell wall biosynthesis